eukprot:131414-Hanusia_phi.AAC.9
MATCPRPALDLPRAPGKLICRAPTQLRNLRPPLCQSPGDSPRRPGLSRRTVPGPRGPVSGAGPGPGPNRPGPARAPSSRIGPDGASDSPGRGRDPGVTRCRHGLGSDSAAFKASGPGRPPGVLRGVGAGPFGRRPGRVRDPVRAGHA